MIYTNISVYVEHIYSSRTAADTDHNWECVAIVFATQHRAHYVHQDSSQYPAK